VSGKENYQYFLLLYSSIKPFGLAGFDHVIKTDVGVKEVRLGGDNSSGTEIKKSIHLKCYNAIVLL
jgi:hypothetical protein